MCKLEQLLHILHKSSKRSESKTKINALTHFAYLNTHYKFCVKHYSQCTIFGVEIIKHFALFFQEIYAGDKKNYAPPVALVAPNISSVQPQHQLHLGAPSSCPKKWTKKTFQLARLPTTHSLARNNTGSHFLLHLHCYTAGPGPKSQAA